MALNLNRPFISALILACLSLILTVIAYASPHWVDSFPDSNNPFLSCGLWEICWNDYTFPLDLKGRRFVGCFWILGREIYEFRDIILKGVFIGVIVIFTIQLAMQVITSVVLVVSWIRCIPSSIQYGVHYACAGSFIVMAGLSFMGLVMFGVQKEDRMWMYRPDQNILSWSYGLSCVAMLFNLLAAYFLYKEGKQAIKKAYSSSSRAMYN